MLLSLQSQASALFAGLVESLVTFGKVSMGSRGQEFCQRRGETTRLVDHFVGKRQKASGAILFLQLRPFQTTAHMMDGDIYLQQFSWNH